MGTRLECKTKDERIYYYGTKLYGYTSEEELWEMPSFKYLQSLHIGMPWFIHECTDDFELTSEQFETFIKLYQNDYNNFYGEEVVETKLLPNLTYIRGGHIDLLNDEEIKALIESKEPVLISWG